MKIVSIFAPETKQITKFAVSNLNSILTKLGYF